jgi:ornithine--oxo-acid transaminase
MFGKFAKQITEMFGYDMVLPMNTGAEAVETAIKLARKWAYEKKGVPEGKAVVLSVSENFHGRTLGVIRSVVCEYFDARRIIDHLTAWAQIQIAAGALDHIFKESVRHTPMRVNFGISVLGKYQISSVPWSWMARMLPDFSSNPFRVKQGRHRFGLCLFSAEYYIRFRIVVPPEGYLAEVQDLCKKHNVLLICDEIQTVRATVYQNFALAEFPSL